MGRLGEAASNIGTFLGMLLSGPIIDNFNFSAIWVVNLVLYVFTLCYILVIPANPKPEVETETEHEVSTSECYQPDDDIQQHTNR